MIVGLGSHCEALMATKQSHGPNALRCTPRLAASFASLAMTLCCHPERSEGVSEKGDTERLSSIGK